MVSVEGSTADLGAFYAFPQFFHKTGLQKPPLLILNDLPGI
jgi:hypothetical protein